MATNLRRYPFDDSGNTLHVLAGKDDPTATGYDDYAVDELEFAEAGVFLVRTGTDRVFIPYSNIRRIYQVI